MFRVTRRWELHVWELKGRPDTWGSSSTGVRRPSRCSPTYPGSPGELGAGARVLRAANVPCLFPNVEWPVEADQNFHALY